MSLIKSFFRISVMLSAFAHSLCFAQTPKQPAARVGQGNASTSVTANEPTERSKIPFQNNFRTDRDVIKTRPNLKAPNSRNILNRGGSTVVGNGGNTFEIEFNGLFNEVIMSWRAARVEKIGSMTLSDLLTMQGNLGDTIRVQIGEKEPVEVNVGGRQAINQPLTGLIYVKQSDWERLGRLGRKKLTVHEILGVHGLASSDTAGKLTNLIVDGPSMIQEFLDFSPYLRETATEIEVNQLCKTALLGILSFLNLGGSVNQANREGKVFLHELSLRGCADEIQTIAEQTGELQFNVKMNAPSLNALAFALSPKRLTERNLRTVKILLRYGASASQTFGLDNNPTSYPVLISALQYAKALLALTKNPSLSTLDKPDSGDDQIIMRAKVVEMLTNQ